MSLITHGLGHLTVITMGLGNSLAHHGIVQIFPRPKITFEDRHVDTAMIDKAFDFEETTPSITTQKGGEVEFK